MRILYIVHQFMPEFSSGTERVTLNLAKAAQASGHQVDILTCSVRAEILWPVMDEAGLRLAVIEGVPVHAIAANPGTSLANLGFEEHSLAPDLLDRFLNGREPYDLVHITHAMRMLEVAEQIQARRIPYVLTLTDFFLACYRINLVQLSGALCAGPAKGAQCAISCPGGLGAGRLAARQERMRSILDQAAAIVACSDYVAEVFRREHPDLPIQVIGHGVDLLRFDGRKRRARDGTLVFGYVGTLSEAKGVHILAEAFVDAAIADARLDLIGPIHDEIFALRLREIVARSDRIVIHPAAPAQAIPALLEQFDVLCLPTLVPETFSLAVHEGFAAGVPCIVSDLGYPAQVVRAGRCGDIARAGEVRDWRALINRIAHDPALLDGWRDNLPLPRRIEEEAFLYSQIYRGARRLAA
jgi:glycosyltransferase involved in cell wall biosynthesis